MKLNFLSLWALAGSASAYLATTTHYYDGQEGACGCGTSSGLDTWQLGIATDVYTAAGSQALFDTDDSSWCGGGCGKCYNLTSTGESPCSTCGTGGVTGDSIIVMVTNLCPYNGNEQWCPPVDSTNDYGYSYHFDIMAESEVFGNNVVVNFEPVACPGQATTDWETCICYGETDDDTTPAGMTTAAGSSGTVATSAVSSISSTSTVVPASSTTAAESSTSTTLVEVASSSSSTQAPSTIVEPSSATSAVVDPSSTSTPVIVEPSSTTSPVVAQSSTTTSASPEGAVTTTTTSVILSTVVSETITIWATSSPTSSGAASPTSSSSGAVQSLYGQCGGINWTGATACATGSTCKVQNPYYYQCVSSSD